MILVLGLAGSGKSTQCELLAKTGRFQWLSIGQMLRSSITDLGLKRTIDSGDVLRDDLVIPMVESEIVKRGDQPELILDGFPRTLDQVKWLLGLQSSGTIKIKCVLHLKVGQEVAYARLLKRGRTDDHDAAINERFNEYKSVILPILDYLKTNNIPVCEIDGEQQQDSVHRSILEALDKQITKKQEGVVL